MCQVVLFALTAKAQFYNFPADYSFSLLTEKQLAAKDSSIHTGLKPYIHFFSNKYVHVADSHRIFKYIKDDPALDVVFYKHLIRVKPPNQKFKLTLDPIIDFNFGRDYHDTLITRTKTNTRGFIGAGYVGDKVYFETIFAENQAVFPVYVSDYANSTSIIPGQGRWKAFKKNGYDYAYSSGFVSIQATRNFNVQFGHGKQKIGNGYRSLLLSDNTLNYPYARFTQQWFKGRLQYTNIYAVLMNLDSASKHPTPNAERLFQKKAASFQYLSLNLTKWLNFSFFQGMIWQTGNDRNKQNLSWQYFNPVIFTNLAQYQLNNTNNILIGIDFRLKITNKLNMYGQAMADDLSNSKALGNGTGYQVGFNYYDALGIRNLFLQAEYNSVTETSYSSPPGVSRGQAYTNYNQPLAFTPGYGNEFVFMADYKYKRLFINVKYNLQNIPLNGNDLYDTQLANAKIGWLLNPAYNLNISLGYTYRNQNFSNFKSLTNQTNYFYFGIKTNLYNLYYDF